MRSQEVFFLIYFKPPHYHDSPLHAYDKFTICVACLLCTSGLLFMFLLTYRYVNILMYSKQKACCISPKSPFPNRLCFCSADDGPAWPAVHNTVSPHQEIHNYYEEVSTHIRYKLQQYQSLTAAWHKAQQANADVQSAEAAVLQALQEVSYLLLYKQTSSSSSQETTVVTAAAARF